MSQAAHCWAWGWWGVRMSWMRQQLNCCSSASFRSETQPPAQVCIQTREVLQPWNVNHSPGMCATHMHCSRSGGGPSITLTSSFPSGLGQDHPLYHALQFYWCWTVSSPFPLPIFFFFFDSAQRCSHCNPEVSMYCPCYLTAGSIVGGGSGFTWGCIQGDRSELADRSSTVWRVARALNLVRCVTPMFLAIPCAKGSGCPMPPCETLDVSSTSFFCLAKWQEVSLLFLIISLISHNLCNGSDLARALQILLCSSCALLSFPDLRNLRSALCFDLC